ncbi:MAG: hypothetical protein HYS70_02665 [Nitrospinae bacterium]|nr:hypothetical protein [Nitrospinota bacterium]
MGELCKSCWTGPAELCASCLDKMVGNLRNRLIAEDIRIMDLREKQRMIDLKQGTMEKRLKELEEILAQAGLNQEETIAHMADQILQFLESNRIESPGPSQVGELALNLYRIATKRRIE